MTASGMECMDRVIELSQDLHELKVEIDGCNDHEQREKLEHLLRRYSKRLTSLEARRSSAHKWIPKAARLCPTRCNLPNLEIFWIDGDRSQGQLPDDCPQWFVVMASAPSRFRTSSLDSRSYAMVELELDNSPKDSVDTERYSESKLENLRTATYYDPLQDADASDLGDAATYEEIVFEVELVRKLMWECTYLRHYGILFRDSPFNRI
ncbi:hypothetical protein BC939DRAFT_501157 [Gamsiella multidivaricata]|uniref:uncharacterized protein n=1 Tax=Gamsiella multidivaricata TaxID=101098 RepID=UPI00221FAB9B|nr:uncharacterized protein BC939DRAFT_501157 [Gamsiella multidivaricata]KAI7827618.1 hypothetical protein BC939DRAFT_501157 [Gamsiella multidivaricata]